MRLVAAALASTIALASSPGEAREMPPLTLRTEVATPVNALAFDLADRVADKAEGNFVISPMSVASALSMTLLGADGETATQMRRLLKGGARGDRIHYGFEAFRRHLGISDAKDTLVIANRLFGAAGEDFLRPFLHETGAAYGARLKQVDFGADGGEAARKIINDWVAGQTKDRIPALLPRRSVDGQTRLVLVNALSFDGKWKHPFDPDDSFSAPFHRADEEPVEATFMSRVGRYRLDAIALEGEGHGYEVLHLPYEGGRFDMLVALPNEGTALDAVWSHLPTGYGQILKKKAAQQKVRVRLPRFEARYNAELRTQLEALGMVDAFGPKADFSKMNGKRDLYLSAVIHESWIQVDEAGTKAAAATAVVAARKGIPRLKNFRADRPFIYLLRDAETGAIVFIGRVSDPTTT